MTPLIKICGIARTQDALLAVEPKADFLGLIFAPESPRFVSVDTAREIVDAVKGRVRTVGVFQNQSREEVLDIIERVGLDVAQLHGEEPPEYCAGFPVPVIKALVLDENFTPELARNYRNVARYVLLDRRKGSPKADWLPWALDTLERIGQDLPPYFFAGGLGPDNLETVLRRLSPAGADVASGVEASPGVKDPRKLKEFCQTVRRFQTGDQHSEEPLSCNP